MTDDGVPTVIERPRGPFLGRRLELAASLSSWVPAFGIGLITLAVGGIAILVLFPRSADTDAPAGLSSNSSKQADITHNPPMSPSPTDGSSEAEQPISTESSSDDELRQLEQQTGFTVAAMREALGRTKGVGKLEELFRDLTERIQLDAEGERYLLGVVDGLEESEQLIKISSEIYREMYFRLESLEPEILDGIRSGNFFANPYLRAQYREIKENGRDIPIPALKTRRIKDAILSDVPVLRRDIVSLIVYLRTTNNLIEDIAEIDHPLSQFISGLPPQYRQENFSAETAADGASAAFGYDVYEQLNDEERSEDLRSIGIYSDTLKGNLEFEQRNRERTQQFEQSQENVNPNYPFPKSGRDAQASIDEILGSDLQRTAQGLSEHGVSAEGRYITQQELYFWCYERYGVFAPFNLKGNHINNVTTVNERVATQLGQFIGRKPAGAAGGSPSSLAPHQPGQGAPSSDGRSVGQSDSAAGRPNTAANSHVVAFFPVPRPVRGTGPASQDIEKARKRLIELQDERWAPAIESALEYQDAFNLGLVDTTFRFEGIAGDWFIRYDELVPDARASPLTITDELLIELLVEPPPVEDPYGYLGKEDKSYEFPGVLPGTWVLVFEETGVAGRPKVVGLQQTTEEYPKAPQAPAANPGPEIDIQRVVKRPRIWVDARGQRQYLLFTLYDDKSNKVYFRTPDRERISVKLEELSPNDQQLISDYHRLKTHTE